MEACALCAVTANSTGENPHLSPPAPQVIMPAPSGQDATNQNETLNAELTKATAEGAAKGSAESCTDSLLSCLYDFICNGGGCC